MVINTNTTALSSARLLSQSSDMLSKSLERLSSGSKIVSPDDDPAGLAVSMNFSAQINRVSAAQGNVGNAISFSQTRDGFLQQVGSALDRMSQLAMMAQDKTKSASDLNDYQTEFSQLASYVNDLGSKDFNGVKLFATTVTVGVTTDSEGKTMNLAALDNSQFNALTSLNIATGAVAALQAVTTAIQNVATQRAEVGADISELNSYSSQLGVLSDNLSAANSRIADVDVATESANYAKYNILVQAGTAMLAQANAAPQAALKLLS